MPKLLVCVVHRDDAGRVISAFQEGGLRITQLGSQGGFLRARNATLMLGLDDAQVEPALVILEENCQTRTEQVPMELLGGMDAAWLPTEVTHGGATIFILPMDEIRRI
ncbi:MAG: cyclic-di-AMP receptor [Chloroflexi bacterium]|jgi:uncharacterized protein YaaQ|nr:cyclic-di-AMP receptor [Chloroflexota bacterium]MBA3851301.1 cyclic-di-AMP receptor [Chloroflexota bacterium]